MVVLLIVVFDENFVIGCKGQLFWYLLDDLCWFKEFIFGKYVLMGYIIVVVIGKLLLGCINLVLFKCYEVLFVGQIMVCFIEEVCVWVDGIGFMVIGGGQVYVEVLLVVQWLYFIWVNVVVDGVDMFFFGVYFSDWIEVLCIYYKVDVEYVYDFDMVEYICNY